MMAAMMLPAVVPVVVGFSRTGRGGGAPSFVAGYLVAWTGYGLAAYGVDRAVDAAAPPFLAWDAQGRYVGGAALVIAGLYQLGPLKTVCLRRCRSPLHFMLHPRPGRAGAMRLGAQHGAYCVGCCGGLMLALFALGIMSLFWMAVVAGVVFVEKVAPAGDRLAGIFAFALVALGIWVAASPATVPGLTTPQPMQMQAR
jgi:predicted metal-binding membrane protein